MTDDEEREVAAHHEAGHAVAATMRGGASLTAVSLDERRHGVGITWTRASVFDRWFITWAGPFAEARHAWGAKPLNGEDDEGLTFDDHLAGVILTQPSDGAVIVACERERVEVLRGATGPDGTTLDEDGVRTMLTATEVTWRRELEAVWPAVEAVARMLLHGQPVTDVAVRDLVGRAQGGVACPHWHAAPPS